MLKNITPVVLVVITIISRYFRSLWAKWYSQLLVYILPQWMRIVEREDGILMSFDVAGVDKMMLASNHILGYFRLLHANIPKGNKKI